MTDHATSDGDDAATRVIFSLTVVSEHPIEAFRDLPGRRRAPREGDDHLDQFGTISFSEDDWERRADELGSAVHEALDRLDATGIDPMALTGDGVSVRAFFTFNRGAETIAADLVARLARIHAAIWIDAT